MGLNNCGCLIFFTYFFLLFSVCACENAKNDDNRDEDMSDDNKEESLDIFLPTDTESSNLTVCARRKNNLMHEIRIANTTQFPFVVAIMSSRKEYVCAGSIIANGLILTTAKCTESISYVLVSSTDDKMKEISLNILKSENFPTYTQNNVMKDVGIIYTEKFNNTIASKISISNYSSVQKLNDVQALGFGLNVDLGSKKEMQYVGLEARFMSEDKIVGFLDCIDTKVVTCFKDKGGPVIFNNELVGITVLGQNDCISEMTSKYATNKLMITAIPTYTFKSWLDEKIAKNNEQGDDSLESFPRKPIVRQAVPHAMTSATGCLNKLLQIYIMMPVFIFEMLEVTWLC